MSYELRSVAIRDVRCGKEQGVCDGVLTVDPEVLTQLVLEDRRVQSVRFDLAKPGESCRILPVKDVIEPRAKLEGGEAFRGLFGLANEASARTHALADFVTDGALEGLFRKALRGERVVARAGSFEVTLAPNAAGRKTIGVVGSVARAEG